MAFTREPLLECFQIFPFILTRPAHSALASAAKLLGNRLPLSSPAGPVGDGWGISGCIHAGPGPGLSVVGYCGGRGSLIAQRTTHFSRPT
jgi:hypothetical protein